MLFALHKDNVKVYETKKTVNVRVFISLHVNYVFGCIIMSIEKYSSKSTEIKDFEKATREILSGLNFIIEYGKKRLGFGMSEWLNVDKRPSFVIDKPPYSYKEKNLYIDASNNLCFHSSMWEKLPVAVSEIYFEELLNDVRTFEESNRHNSSRYNFNKGIVYGNLGVTQAAQRKLDEGFANILKALDEDRGYSTASQPDYDIFKRDLFSQFEKRYVTHALESYAGKMKDITIGTTKKFVEEFMNSLSPDQRAFFDCTFARILQNWEIWNEKNNRFTSGRLLAYIQDLCLFGEDLLKTKGFSGTLNPMISAAFRGITLSNCGADSLNQLNGNLQIHFGESNSKHKCLKILLTVRNFTSHNIAGGTSSDFSYSNYEEILVYVLQAIFYIHQLP